MYRYFLLFIIVDYSLTYSHLALLSSLAINPIFLASPLAIISLQAWLCKRNDGEREHAIPYFQIQMYFPFS
jgi:hypothetical protein